MSASNKAAVQHLFNQGLNDHNLSLMMELLSDCTFHMPLVGELKGESLRQFFASLVTAFPDIHRTMEELVTDNVCTVVIRWIVTGTHLGPSWALPRQASPSTLLVCPCIVFLADKSLTSGWNGTASA